MALERWLDGIGTLNNIRFILLLKRLMDEILHHRGAYRPPRTPLDPGPARGTGRDGIMRIGPGGRGGPARPEGRSGPIFIIPSRPVPRTEGPGPGGSGGSGGCQGGAPPVWYRSPRPVVGT